MLHVVLKLDPGGTERLVVELIRRLHTRFGMAVCCLDEAGRWADQVQRLGVEVTALRRAPGFHLGTARALARVARGARTHVLHCHHFSPFVYGRLASLLVPGSRIVFTEHGRLSDAPPSRRRQRATRLLAKGVSALYAVSHDLRAHLLAEGFPDRMGVIWNGIDPGPPPETTARLRARAALGAADDEVLIGAVGRLDPVKDFAMLLTAFASAHATDARLRLVLIGDGPERASLEAAVAAHGLGDVVRMLGHREDVRELLPGLDVFANSSITEGVSLTILEAMATEVPVVATRVGGTPEVVVDGTGLLCEARDPRSFEALLRRLTSERDLARACGRAGRRRVLEHFTLDRMVERYAEIYQHVSSGVSRLPDATTTRAPDERPRP